MLLYRSLLLLVLLPAAHAAHAATAVFAGGCFWCVEALYQEVEGVSDVVSGFTGGTLPNPTYSGNHDGHWEAVRVEYDPAVVSYRELLDLYWVNIDPFNARGQFCDKAPVTVRPSSLRMTGNAGLPRRRSVPLSHASRDGTLRPTSCPPAVFGWSRPTTRTTTRRIQSATASIVLAAGATRVWSRFGAMTRATETAGAHLCCNAIRFTLGRLWSTLEVA